MKICKVILLVPANLSSRDYNRFGIDILKASGFEIEVLNLSKLLYGRLDSGESQIVKTVFVQNYKQLHAYIETTRQESVFVLLIGQSSKTIKVSLMLDRVGAISIAHNANATPMAIADMPVLQKIGYFFKTFNLKSLLERVYYLYVIRKKGLPSPSCVILGGSASLRRETENSIHVWAHCLDYDIYLEKRNIKADMGIKGKYCVFIDAYLPHHPDIAKVGLDKKYMSFSQIYYKKLCGFFDFVEKKYGIEVVIAAHPRSEYEKIGDVWGGRKHLKNKTFELIRDCEFCMMHSSTSINFCVMMKKPVLFLTMEEIEPFEGFYIDVYSKEIGGKKIFIDRPDDYRGITDDIGIDKKKYMKYKEKYIKKEETPEQNSWQIFAECLRREFELEEYDEYNKS